MPLSHSNDLHVAKSLTRNEDEIWFNCQLIAWCTFQHFHVRPKPKLWTWYWMAFVVPRIGNYRMDSYISWKTQYRYLYPYIFNLKTWIFATMEHFSLIRSRGFCKYLLFPAVSQNLPSINLPKLCLGTSIFHGN
jgi:hypothetical protein